MAIATVVVDTDRRNLIVQITDENNQVVDLTNGSASLRGRSQDIPSGPGSSIDRAGVITDPTQGEVKWSGYPSYLTQADLNAASVRRATFRFRVYYVDVAAKDDYTDSFEIVFDSDPLEPYW